MKLFSYGSMKIWTDLSWKKGEQREVDSIERSSCLCSRRPQWSCSSGMPLPFLRCCLLCIPLAVCVCFWWDLQSNTCILPYTTPTPRNFQNVLAILKHIWNSTRFHIVDMLVFVLLILSYCIIFFVSHISCLRQVSASEPWTKGYGDFFFGGGCRRYYAVACRVGYLRGEIVTRNKCKKKNQHDTK